MTGKSKQGALSKLRNFSLTIVLGLAIASPAFADAGHEAFKRGNFGEALRLWQAAAAKGDAFSENALGNLYMRGNGVAKDLAAAAKWYERSAENGYPPAQFNLAVLYAKGWGVRRNEEKAVKLVQEAAKNGFTAAQFLLGRAYLEGKGVPKDYVRARKWLDLAAAQNFEGAAAYRALLAEKMSASPPALASNSRQTKIDAPKAANNENANSELIKLIQQHLHRLGYSVGAIDGVAGRRTSSAISRYQSANKLEVNGKASQALLQHMNGSQMANRTPSRKTQSSQAFSLRGIRLGLPLSEFRRLRHPDGVQAKVICTGDAEVKDDFGLLDLSVYGDEATAGIIKCNFYKPGTRGPYSPPSWQQVGLKVATVGVYMEYAFIRDPSLANEPALYKIVARSNVGYWEKVWRGFTGKYNKPTKISNAPTQNKAGTSFDNIDAYWINQVSGINLIKRFNRVDNTYIFYIHHRLASLFDRLVERVDGKPSDNL